MQEPTGTMQIAVPINPRRIALILAGIAVYLAVQSLAAKVLELSMPQDTTNVVYNLLTRLNINRESSIPTWFSASLLLFCAALFGVIAAARRSNREPFYRHWAGLAFIFLYLSMDEASAFHETLTDPLQALFDTSGALYFAWVIVGLPLVAVFALVYLRFLLHLPPQVRRLFITAGVVYVVGAIFIESFSAHWWYWDDGSSLRYSVVGTVEELCEMLGVIIMIYTLLGYIEQVHAGVRAQPHLAIQSSSAPVFPLPGLGKMPLRRWGMLAALAVVCAGWLLTLPEADNTPQLQNATRSLLAAYSVHGTAELPGQQLIISEVEHFFASADGQYDLIVADARSPVNARAALLYSEAFYLRVREHLNQRGVFVTGLGAPFDLADSLARRGAVGLLRTFDDVFVVTDTSSGMRFAFAGDDLPFDGAALGNIFNMNGETRYRVLETEQVRALVGNTLPVGALPFELVFRARAASLTVPAVGDPEFE